MKNKVLVTGSAGMLGQDIIKVFSKDSNLEIIGVDLKDFDITCRNLTLDTISNINPDYIIHTAAYTNVDGAESDKENCFKINYEGTKNIVDAAKKNNAVLCYISTDFIFDGNKKDAYLEDNIPNPIGVYGLSKLKGEEYILNSLEKFFVIRISWLYGKHGKNFISTIKKLCAEQQELSIVSDQIGTPTYTKDIANNLLELLETNKFGIYHMTGKGCCSWYDFAKKIAEICGFKTRILSITSDKLDRPAKRPFNSVLNNDKINKLLGRQVMPDWEESLEQFLKTLL